MYWIYIYLAVVVFALLIEFFTSEMVSVWFVGGGVISMILSALNVGWEVHFPVFIGVSIILLACFRKFALKYFSNGETKTNADSAVGKEYELLTEIGFNKPGTININDVIWSAVSEKQEDVIPKGSIVIVVGIKGNKYIVKEK